MTQDTLRTILDKHQHEPNRLLAILQDVQAVESYLPRPALATVAQDLDISLSKIYGMATFFSAFSLEPRGEHICTICCGTGCHVRGAQRLVDHVSRTFAIDVGGTSDDQKVTLETVNCVGACALAPLVIVDGAYHGNMTPARLDRLFKKLRVSGS